MVSVAVICASIYSVIGTIAAFIASMKKIATFVIAAVIWTSYLGVVAAIIRYGQKFSSSYSEVSSGLESSSNQVATSFVGFLQKAQYWFPVSDLLKCIGILISVSLGVVALRWILRVWEAVPFKGSAGS